MNWSKQELALLKQLRFEKPFTPYAQCPQLFKDICGTSRSQDAIRFKAYEIRNKNKIAEIKDEVVAVYDIETTDWHADAGFMLGWAVYYPHTGQTKSDFIKKEELYNFKFDKRICKSLLKEFENIDLIIGYYSTGFDNPFFRTRSLMNNLKFPVYGSMRHHDCYYMARGKVKTRKKSLGVIAEALGLDAQKTHESISVWNLAKYGHPASLKKIRQYNINDVIVTWEVYNELLKYGKFAPKSI